MWNRLPPAAKRSNRYLDFKSQALQYNIREVLHSESRNNFRNVAAAVEKVVELSECVVAKVHGFAKMDFRLFHVWECIFEYKKVYFSCLYFCLNNNKLQQFLRDGT